jgi:hypothetical protein
MGQPRTVTTVMDAHANASMDGQVRIVKQGHRRLVMQLIATTTASQQTEMHQTAVIALVTLDSSQVIVPFQLIAIIRIAESIPPWMTTALMDARATASMVGLATIARPHHPARARLIATTTAQPLMQMRPMDVNASALQMKWVCGLAPSARQLLCLHPVLLVLIATVMAQLLI